MSYGFTLSPLKQIKRPSACGETLRRPRLQSKLDFKDSAYNHYLEQPPNMKQKQLSLIPLTRSISKSMSKSPSRITPTTKPILTPTKSPSSVTFGRQENLQYTNHQSKKQFTTKALKSRKFDFQNSPSFSNIGSEKSASYSDMDYFKHLFSSKALTSPPQKQQSFFKNQRQGRKKQERGSVCSKNPLPSQSIKRQVDMRAQLEEIYNGKFKVK